MIKSRNIEKSECVLNIVYVDDRSGQNNEEHRSAKIDYDDQDGFTLVTRHRKNKVSEKFKAGKYKNKSGKYGNKSGKKGHKTTMTIENYG